MKKLLLILLSALCLCALIACQPAGGPTGDPTAPTQPTTPGVVPDDGTFGLLKADGTARYTVVRSDLGSREMTALSLDVCRAIETALKLDYQTCPIGTDWREKTDTDEDINARYEILVGKTNRTESKDALAALGEYSYTIRVVNRKIVLLGSDEKGTGEAVKLFISQYLADPTTVTETLCYDGTYTPDPTDIVLEDHSTGKTNPRVPVTQYPTDDVVIADIIPTEDGYAVDATGRADSTAGIQKALNDCSANGGGTVYLPAGKYVVANTVVIPPYVTLRGDWQDPDVGNDYGTIILVYAPSKDVVTEGLFMLGGSGGVVGLTVYYHDQTLENVQKYPFTFYTDGSGANYMLSTVKNCTVLNGYRGIGACCTPSGAHEQLTVENFKGTFLYSGTEVYNQADVGTWVNVTVNNRYWINAGAGLAPADAEQLNAYTKKNTVGLMLGDLEWTEFQNLNVSGCKIGIQIVQGKRIQFAGSLNNISVTDCTVGLQVDDLDPRWGMVIASSTIEGGIDNNTSGAVKLCDVKVTGDMSGQIIQDTTSDLSAIQIDTNKSYQKPAANLFVANVTKDGSADVSAELQKLLDEAGKTGGVVYIPGGYYRLDHALTVPAGVELRGSSSVATRDQGGLCKGTVILSYFGLNAKNPETDQALITLAGENAGINGIRIVYPTNGAYAKNLHSSYTVRGTASGVYVVNSCIFATGYGIDFRDCDNHFIKKLSSCCYYNTMRVGGEGGIITGCLQNATVLARCSVQGLENWIPESEVFANLFDPILRAYAEYIIVDGGEGETVYNTFCYGCAVFIINRDSEDTLVVNIGSDNIGKVQTIHESGSMTTVNSMRWNGKSYEYTEGSLSMYNRLTINIKDEKTTIK